MENLFILIETSSYNNGSTKTTKKISLDKAKMIKPLIEAIKENKEHYNWTNATEVVHKSGYGYGPDGWTTDYKVFGMYRSINKNIIKEFMNYLPNVEIDSIENVTFATLTPVEI